MQQFDVLVAGAGLAGLQTARLLAKQGWRVLLVDRKRQVSQSVHTTGIFVRRTLEEFSLPTDCLGPVVRHVRLISPKRRQLSLECPLDEFRIGKMGRLYERMLADTQISGGQWRAETTLESVTAAEGGSHVRLVHVGNAENVFVRYLVGADGIDSRVAASLGLSRNRESIVGVEEVFEGAKIDGPPCLFCFLDPRLAPGYIAWIAYDGEETHIGVGGYANRFEPRRALTKFLQEASEFVDLSQAQLLERRGGRIPVGGLLPHIVCDRGLLVGDAAGAVSPLTAGGLDPCLRQAAHAAGVIAHYLAHSDPATLIPYQSAVLRHRFLTRRILRMGLSLIRTPFAAEAVVGLLRTFPFNLVAHRVFFGRGSFPLESYESLRPCGPETVA